MVAEAAPRFAAVGAGRMGRGIAIAFAYAGHRISLIDLRDRSDDAWLRWSQDAGAEIAAFVRKPERFLNIHWLNPAYVIPVVELSRHPGTAQAVLGPAESEPT